MPFQHPRTAIKSQFPISWVLKDHHKEIGCKGENLSTHKRSEESQNMCLDGNQIQFLIHYYPANQRDGNSGPCVCRSADLRESSDKGSFFIVFIYYFPLFRCLFVRVCGFVIYITFFMFYFRFLFKEIIWSVELGEKSRIVPCRDIVRCLVATWLS